MKSTLKALAIALIPILLISLSILTQSCGLTKEAVVEVEPEPTMITWTYEGPVNPNEFGDWKEIKNFPANSYGFYWYTIKNPDPNSEVELVQALINVVTPTMYGYRFWIGSEPFMYFITEDGKGYKDEYLTPQEKQHCMSCHQDKIKPVKRSI